jgi:hypothetical protein
VSTLVSALYTWGELRLVECAIQMLNGLETTLASAIQSHYGNIAFLDGFFSCFFRLGQENKMLGDHIPASYRPQKLLAKIVMLLNANKYLKETENVTYSICFHNFQYLPSAVRK